MKPIEGNCPNCGGSKLSNKSVPGAAGEYSLVAVCEYCGSQFAAETPAAPFTETIITRHTYINVSAAPIPVPKPSRHPYSKKTYQTAGVLSYIVACVMVLPTIGVTIAVLNPPVAGTDKEGTAVMCGFLIFNAFFFLYGRRCRRIARSM